MLIVLLPCGNCVVLVRLHGKGQRWTDYNDKYRVGQIKVVRNLCDYKGRPLWIDEPLRVPQESAGDDTIRAAAAIPAMEYIAEVEHEGFVPNNMIVNA